MPVFLALTQRFGIRQGARRVPSSLSVDDSVLSPCRWPGEVTHRLLSTHLPPQSLLGKKTRGKNTYPLPPTGFVPFFCAKTLWGAIGAPGQAGCGLARANGNCAECKGLQRNVTVLHKRLGRLVGSTCRETPVVPGRKIGKPPKRWIFQICNCAADLHPSADDSIFANAWTPSGAWPVARFVSLTTLHNRACP